MRVDYQFSNKTWWYLALEEYRLNVGGFTGVGTDRFAYQNR